VRRFNGFNINTYRNAPMTQLETHSSTASLPRLSGRSSSSEGGRDFPVLVAGRAGPSERLADSFRRVHPALVFTVVMLTGLAAIAVLSIGLGLLITRILEPAWGIGTTDEHFNVWLAAHRTPTRTDASLVGSIMAGGVVLPIIVGSIAIVCALSRQWLAAAFAVFALVVESATYRATTLVVHAHRPRVARLEHLPVNASYPSGHTAAAIAVYGGLILLLTSTVTKSVLRASAWTLAVAVVAFVAMSRMYRGMHHPLDVAGGVVVGVAAVIVVLFACRTAGAAAQSRRDGRVSGAAR
jgi:undecaprenyl-diphosphatase